MAARVLRGSEQCFSNLMNAHGFSLRTTRYRVAWWRCVP